MIQAAVLKRLRAVLPAQNILENEPMRLHTTFRIGGPADVLCLPENDEQVAQIVVLLKEEQVPFYIVGNGSNILVKDHGFRGCIVKMLHQGREIRVDREAKTLYAGAGETMMSIAVRCAEEGLGGMEFASGIPGTLGGTVSMNAGAYEKEMKDIVNSVRILTQEGEIKEISNAEMAFGYRTSAVLKNNWIVLGATLQLQQDDPVEIQARIDDFTHRRRTRQPLEYASAGSTFKRPEGFFAAKLIDDAGMKGYSVGDAQVSEKHAGCVVNKGRASAEDVLALMSRIQAAVKEKFGVDLKPEVRIIGE